MHSRYPRAAVATEGTPFFHRRSASPRPTISLNPSKSARVLWATSAMPVQAGRLVGVRLVGQVIEVALVRSGAERLDWVVADKVLNDSQVSKWLRMARFAP
jgi:hypothetical protein